MIRQSWRPTVALAVLLLLPGATAVAQSVLPKSSELVAFMGRWVFTTTNPQGSQQTVRIWDKSGGVAAGLQIGKLPPNDMLNVGRLQPSRSARRVPAFISPSYSTWSRLASGQLSLEALVSGWYEREFGETIPRPATFDDDRAVDCRGDGHLTTTAFLRNRGRTADVLVLYLTRDGLNLVKKSRATVLVPLGTFRVLSIVVGHTATVGSEPLSKWQLAQDEVNQQHAEFARNRGYVSPLVAFTNRNLVVDPGQFATTDNSDAIAAVMEAHHLSRADYDIVMVINIDPARSEGGRAGALVGLRSVYVGNFAHWRTALSARDWSGIARTAYQQLMAYHWGWQTDCTPTCGGTRLGYEPFITAPRLFGWEDVDGDGVPEIIDDTPYGRSRY